MMAPKSMDFITGYVFCKMDRSIFKYINSEEYQTTFTDSHAVPKIWFEGKYTKGPLNDLNDGVKANIKAILEQSLSDLYPKWETRIVSIAPERQYIRFDYVVCRKVEPKKMTVAEIEKELGYKIAIID